MTSNGKITEHDAHIIGAMKQYEFTDEDIQRAIDEPPSFTQWGTLISGMSFLIIILLGLGYIAGSFIAAAWFK